MGLKWKQVEIELTSTEIKLTIDSVTVSEPITS